MAPYGMVPHGDTLTISHRNTPVYISTSTAVSIDTFEPTCSGVIPHFGDEPSFFVENPSAGNLRARLVDRPGIVVIEPTPLEFNIIERELDEEFPGCVAEPNVYTRREKLILIWIKFLYFLLKLLGRD